MKMTYPRRATRSLSTLNTKLVFPPTYHAKTLLRGGDVDNGAVQFLNPHVQLLDADVEALDGLVVAGGLEGDLFELWGHLVTFCLELGLLLVDPAGGGGGEKRSGLISCRTWNGDCDNGMIVIKSVYNNCDYIIVMKSTVETDLMVM